MIHFTWQTEIQGKHESRTTIPDTDQVGKWSQDLSTNCVSSTSYWLTSYSILCYQSPSSQRFPPYSFVPSSSLHFSLPIVPLVISFKDLTLSVITTLEGSLGHSISEFYEYSKRVIQSSREIVPPKSSHSSFVFSLTSQTSCRTFIFSPWIWYSLTGYCSSYLLPLHQAHSRETSLSTELYGHDTTTYTGPYYFLGYISSSLFLTIDLFEGRISFP